MTKYKVLNQFKEKYHNDHIYTIGDAYPKKGEKFNKTRAEYLSKYNDEFKTTFLEEIKEDKQSTKVKGVKVELEVGETE